MRVLTHLRFVFLVALLELRQAVFLILMVTSVQRDMYCVYAFVIYIPHGQTKMTEHSIGLQSMVLPQLLAYQK